MSEIDKSTQALCPSSKCTDGAQLIGVVKEDGHVDMLKEAIQVDETFVNVAKQGRLPEMRFRFANKCIKNGCKQWTGERCGIIDQIMQHVNETDNTSLPECSIRPQCRWYNQSGMEACKICPLVITDVTEMI
jgi:hypothetical protein